MIQSWHMKIKLTQQDQRKLRRLGVVAVYLFGSRAQGLAGVTSYDFVFWRSFLDEVRTFFDENPNAEF